MLQLFKTGYEYMVESDCYIRTQIGTVRLHKLPDGQSCAHLLQRSHISSALHSWTCPKNTSTPTWKPSSLTSAPIGRPTWVCLPELMCHCCTKTSDVRFNESICSLNRFPFAHLLSDMCCVDSLYFSPFPLLLKSGQKTKNPNCVIHCSNHSTRHYWHPAKTAILATNGPRL